MIKYPHRAADICIEMFPQDSTIDTIRVVKDSLITERKIDSVYTWLVEDHYIDKIVFKDKIKQIIKTSHDTITLPDHWDWLVDEDSVTVQLTPIGKPMSLFVIEQNNKTVKVGGVEGNYNYTIYGTRKDVPDLIVETEE